MHNPSESESFKKNLLVLAGSSSGMVHLSNDRKREKIIYLFLIFPF